MPCKSKCGLPKKVTHRASGYLRVRLTQLPGFGRSTSKPNLAALSSGLSAASHLTPPSSGRPKASCAGFRSPLMSNVRAKSALCSCMPRTPSGRYLRVASHARSPFLTSGTHWTQSAGWSASVRAAHGRARAAPEQRAAPCSVRRRQGGLRLGFGITALGRFQSQSPSSHTERALVAKLHARATLCSNWAVGADSLPVGCASLRPPLTSTLDPTVHLLYYFIFANSLAGVRSCATASTVTVVPSTSHSLQSQREVSEHATVRTVNVQPPACRGVRELVNGIATPRFERHAKLR